MFEILPTYIGSVLQLKAWWIFNLLQKKELASDKLLLLPYATTDLGSTAFSINAEGLAES